MARCRRLTIDRFRSHSRALLELRGGPTSSSPCGRVEVATATGSCSRGVELAPKASRGRRLTLCRSIQDGARDRMDQEPRTRWGSLVRSRRSSEVNEASREGECGAGAQEKMRECDDRQRCLASRTLPRNHPADSLQNSILLLLHSIPRACTLERLRHLLLSDPSSRSIAV